MIVVVVVDVAGIIGGDDDSFDVNITLVVVGVADSVAIEMVVPGSCDDVSIVRNEKKTQ